MNPYPLGWTERLQIVDDLVLAAVLSPAEWGAVVNRVDDIEAGAAFDEELDHLQVPLRNGLVNWRGVAVGAGRIEAVGIFAGVEQETGGVNASCTNPKNSSNPGRNG